MAIFNSLGSNYNFSFAIRALFTSNKKSNAAKLINLLEQKYSGKVYLTYKGREALRLALRLINKQKQYVVGICGFTCFAVYDAVSKEGYRIEYLDIDESLNFSFEKLIETQKKNPDLKILIIQNTLGYPCNMEKISKFCREKNIILIEDLAHSVGTKYADGSEAGTVGDFTVLSFSQDKMIDAVSGGAVIIRNDKFLKSPFAPSPDFKNIPLLQQIKDRFYPLLTWKIRQAYILKIGKAFHWFLKKTNLLSRPMGHLDSSSIYSLPNWYCSLVSYQFKKLTENISQRKKIAKIYAEILNENIQFKKISSRISLSSNLRFPIFVKNRESLITFLKQNKIYVSDIWYDAPIAPKRFLPLTNYKGECPNAQKFSEEILNLPTHKNITKKDAKFIADKVNEWCINE